MEMAEPQFGGLDITKADQTLLVDSEPEELIDEESLKGGNLMFPDEHKQN